MFVYFSVSFAVIYIYIYMSPKHICMTQRPSLSQPHAACCAFPAGVPRLRCNLADSFSCRATAVGQDAFLPGCQQRRSTKRARTEHTSSKQAPAGIVASTPQEYHGTMDLTIARAFMLWPVIDCTGSMDGTIVRAVRTASLVRSQEQPPVNSRPVFQGRLARTPSPL